jgi:hypothetical protein
MLNTDSVFGTILHDVFADGERLDVHTALEELCSPLDSYGWASVGIYAFFDPSALPSPSSMTRAAAFSKAGSRVQYLGLARDLPERFAQHTGLIRFPERGCKVRQIEDWFSQHPALGFSCFVQSPLAQVNTHRERDRFRRAAHDEEMPAGMIDNPPDGLESAAVLEGQMLETFRILQGSLPPWNKVGGNAFGAAHAIEGTGDGLYLLMEGDHPSLFRAQRTIRQLSRDPSATAFEMGPLHTARMETLLAATDERAGDTAIIHTINRLRRNPIYIHAGYEYEVTAMMRDHYLASVPAALELEVEVRPESGG